MIHSCYAALPSIVPFYRYDTGPTLLTPLTLSPNLQTIFRK